MKRKAPKQRYTTYFFPRHFAALEKIAEASSKSVTQVLSEALDTYLEEVGAIKDDERETIAARKEDIRKALEKAERD